MKKKITYIELIIVIILVITFVKIWQYEEILYREHSQKPENISYIKYHEKKYHENWSINLPDLSPEPAPTKINTLLYPAGYIFPKYIITSKTIEQLKVNNYKMEELDRLSPLVNHRYYTEEFKIVLTDLGFNKEQISCIISFSEGDNWPDYGPGGPDFCLQEIKNSFEKAVRNEDCKEIIRIMKESPEIVREKGISSLINAAISDNKKLMILLIESGVDINGMNANRFTPLYEISYHGEKGMVEFLIENGADVNVKGINDFTPLHIAAFESREEIAEVLIENGADINSITEKDNTPLDLAKINKDKEMIDLLEKYGAKEGSEL